jgi:hypothetical protein
MKLLIIGSMGAIGKRYMAVARHLCIDYVGWDLRMGTPMPVLGITHCLICTPTDTHYKIVNTLSNMTDWLLLVEKPLVMVPMDGFVLSFLRGYTVCNWSLVHDGIYKPGTCEITYKSHHTGPDGLPWDTCQLLYLSRPEHPPAIGESPLWSATINGQEVTYRQIEESYIRMIDLFVNRNGEGLWTLNDGYQMTLKCLGMQGP